MKNKFLILILSVGILLPVIKSVAQSDKGRIDDKGFRTYRFSDTNMDVYKLGEKIYYNKVKLPAKPISEDKVKIQNIFLRAMTRGIPESVKKRIDKAKLAGRLDDEQLNALKYYLANRFKQKYGH